MQGVLLEKLQGVPHVIQLLARGTCSYLGRNWHAVLVQPFVTLLSHEDSLQLVGQVGEGKFQIFLACIAQIVCIWKICAFFVEDGDFFAMTLLALSACQPSCSAGCFGLLLMWPKASMGVHNTA